MDPVIQEFCRAKSPSDIRPDVLRRWQAYFRDVIAPALDARQDAAGDEMPVRRGPGRPRKTEATPCA